MASGRGMRGGAGAEKEGKGEREKVGAKVEEEGRKRGELFPECDSPLLSVLPPPPPLTQRTTPHSIYCGKNKPANTIARSPI